MPTLRSVNKQEPHGYLNEQAYYYPANLGVPELEELEELDELATYELDEIAI
jgi:hypothetical protein